uniref:Uncharacterized protein n=1 Tax=Lotharella vacuolata TaxID=74820 RepID=A0A0H5BQW7_9EUKA|nr:hypothetical protein [Lotharella vacuolata]
MRCCTFYIWLFVMLRTLIDRVLDIEIIYIYIKNKKYSIKDKFLFFKILILHYIKYLQIENKLHFHFLINLYYLLLNKLFLKKNIINFVFSFFRFFIIKIIRKKPFSYYFDLLNIHSFFEFYLIHEINTKNYLNNFLYLFRELNKKMTNKNNFIIIKSNIFYNSQFASMLLYKEVYSLYNTATPISNQVLYYVQKFTKKILLLEIFSIFEFYLMFISKKINKNGIKDFLFEKNSINYFIGDIDVSKRTLKLIIQTVIKIIVLHTENNDFIMKIIPIWMKILSYIKLGFFDIFFSSMLLKSLLERCHFNNEKLKLSICSNTNYKITFFFLKSSSIPHIKKQYTKTIKKNMSDMTIFIKYIKICSPITKNNKIDISLKFQFYFLTNFFFSNKKFLKNENHKKNTTLMQFLKYQTNWYINLTTFFKFSFVNILLKFYNKFLLFIINKRNNLFFYVGFNKIIIPIRKHCGFSFNITNILLNLNDVKKNTWTIWNTIKKYDVLYLFFNNIFFTCNKNIIETVAMEKHMPLPKTIHVLEIKKKKFWIFLKCKIIKKNHNFNSCSKIYNFIALLLKSCLFIKNIQKLWHLLIKINMISNKTCDKIQCMKSTRLKLMNIRPDTTINNDIFIIFYKNIISNRYLIKNKTLKILTHNISIKKYTIHKQKNTQFPFFILYTNNNYNNLVTFKKKYNYCLTKISNFLCLSGVGFYKYPSGLGVMKLSLLLNSFCKEIGLTQKTIYLMPREFIIILKNILIKNKHHFSKFLGVFLNSKSLTFEMHKFFKEMRKFYESYLINFGYTKLKKQKNKKKLSDIKNCLVKNILLRYLKQKSLYKNYKKNIINCNKILYYNLLKKKLRTIHFVHTLNFLYKNLETISCLFYIKDNWELKIFFLKKFSHSLCFSSKNLFCLVSWITKLELLFLNFIIVDFDSFLYDNFLYFHVIHILLLNKTSCNKRILVFYRKLNFDKLNLVCILKKLYYKKSNNLNFIYKKKRKNNILTFLRNLQCIRKSFWCATKYNSNFCKFFTFFLLNNKLPFLMKKISWFIYNISLEIIITFLLFLFINGISKIEIGLYLGNKFNYIINNKKNVKKIRLFYKNFLLTKKIQGFYKKIFIFNEKEFSVNYVKTFKIIFQIITHTKQVLILLKIKNGDILNMAKCETLIESVFSTYKIHNAYEKKIYKPNTKFKINCMFIYYLLNYFLLIYLSKIKYFLFLN